MIRAATLLVLLLLSAGPALAEPAEPTQTTDPTYAFADIPWGLTANEYRTRLESHGYVFWHWFGNDYREMQFTGTLAGEKVVVSALGAPWKIEKVGVRFWMDAPRRWPTVFPIYQLLKEQLNSKYGTPTYTYEFFMKPYYLGDGDEAIAFSEEKAVYSCFWGEAGAVTINLRITKDFQIVLTYEGPGWADYATKLQASGLQDL